MAQQPAVLEATKRLNLHISWRFPMVWPHPRPRLRAALLLAVGIFSLALEIFVTLVLHWTYPPLGTFFLGSMTGYFISQGVSIWYYHRLLTGGRDPSVLSLH